MQNEDIIQKYSECHYIEPKYNELYKFEEKDIEKYCNWVKNNYKPIIKSWDISINTYWTAKYYVAVKFLYITNHFIEAYIYAKEKNLKIVLPYLIYYSLLTVSRSLILTSPINDKDIDFVRTHEKIINDTKDIIAKLSFKKSNEYKEIIEIAKNNRELFSYKFPSSGLSLINTELNKIINLVNIVKELAILNSQILDSLLDKIPDKSVFILDGDINSILYKLFEFGDKIDENDYYNVGYISRKIKRPQPLNFMISEGIEEDFYLSWAPEEEADDLFIPPEYIF